MKRRMLSTNSKFGISVICICDLARPLYLVTFSALRWTVLMDGVSGTLYEGEKFQLLFKFTPKYPFDSPEVSSLFLFFFLFY